MWDTLWIVGKWYVVLGIVQKKKKEKKNKVSIL